MPINTYTGLMGSGKSYECVSSVIVPAVRNGRRVVTNVDGIDGDAIRAYCQEKYGVNYDQLGTVVHCTNDDVGKADFLPYGRDDVDTFCQPGDMICIDEAWRFWGTDCKLLPEHKVFFREHRHYVDPNTKVSCDLVLMVQDISDLNRSLKVVVEVTFRTTKLKTLGLNRAYRVEWWEGYKLTNKGRVGVQNKRYDNDIFPLYSSYTGGKGRELQVDSRQNVLKSPKLWLLAVAVLTMGSVSLYSIVSFFNPKSSDEAFPMTPNQGAGAPATSAAKVSGASATQQIRPVPQYSDEWRIVGSIEVDGDLMIVVAGVDGRTRLEHPSVFQHVGTAAGMTGEIDGKRVATWSGPSSVQTGGQGETTK